MRLHSVSTEALDLHFTLGYLSRAMYHQYESFSVIRRYTPYPMIWNEHILQFVSNDQACYILPLIPSSIVFTIPNDMVD